MADNPMTLEQFSQEILAVNRADSDAMMATLEKFKYLFPQKYNEFITQQDVISAVNDQEKLKTVLTNLTSNIEGQPQQVRNIPQDPQTTTEEAVARAQIYVQASKTATQHLTNREERIANLRQNYVHRVMDNFLEKSRVYANKEAIDLEKARVANLQAFKNQKDAEDYITTAARRVSDTNQKETDLRVARLQANEVAAQLETETSTYEREAAALRSAKTYFITQEHPPIRADVFFQEAINRASVDASKSTDTIIHESGAIASMAEGLSADTGGIPMGDHGFFRINSRGPLENVIAPVADLLFDRLAPAQKIDAIRRVAEQSFDRIEKQIGDGTLKIGIEITELHVFRDALLNGGQADAQRTALGGTATKISNIVGDVFGAVKGVDEETIAYMNAARHHVAQAHGAADFHLGDHVNAANFYASILHAKNPETFRVSLSSANIWILQVNSQFNSTALGARSAASGGFKKLLNFGSAALSASLSPVGKLAGSVGSGAIRGAVGFFSNILSAGSFTTAAAGAASGAGAGALALIVGAVILIPLLLTGASYNQQQTALAISIPQGGGGSYTGELQNYSYKQSGPLACLNYNTQTTGIPDTLDKDVITAYQFSPDKKASLDSAIAQFPQIGLYNCLLNCPAHQVNMYAYNVTSANGYYGYSPSGGTLVFYDGLFRDSAHNQARLIAHELAHQLNAAHPEIYDAYINGSTQYPKGYCGCLGTYHFGTSNGGCYSGETAPETFAEAAAMYLTGENLQALCPQGYAFMGRIFNECKQ